MNLRPIAALALCASLASPSAAQMRAAAAAANVPAGVTVVPSLGGSSSFAPALSPSLSAPSLSASVVPVPSAVLAAPAAAPALAQAIVPAAVKPALVSAVPAALKPMFAAASASLPKPGAAVPEAVALRAQGEAFWSGAASKPESDLDVPVAAAQPSASRPSLLKRAAGALAVPLATVPAWFSSAAPYAKGAALLGGAIALSRAVRWAVDRLAAKRGWEKNTVAMWRFVSSLAVWGGAAALGLSMAGISGTDLAETFGVGGTAMALAISLAVRDVAGNLFHGVHFLLTRPFSIGDKVTVGKTTATVRDLTLRYIVLVDDSGKDVLRTYASLASAPVTLYGTYRSKESRLGFRKPTLPHGFLRAVRDAVSEPSLWKPVVFTGLGIAALAFFPMLGGLVAAKSLGWIGVVLPYVKAALVAFLANSVSNSLTRAIGRLGERYGWDPASVTVAKLGASVLSWIVGGSFLLNAVGVSWSWVAKTLSLGTALVTIAVTDYVTSIFSAIIVFRLKPFQIGDENVTIGENTGTVVDITWQNVILKLDDSRYMIIPHSVAKDAEIKNPRRYGERDHR